ncbi:hypothetical protein [Streptomyces sp. NPDC088246]|uniref:hypothetical protein n=1 Tax=Streptomyces sp. NPDC088246 TaxID=3365842 RepID=UPI0037FAF04B
MLFNDKVRIKGKTTPGLFISVNGFSAGANAAFQEGTAFLTIEGRAPCSPLSESVRDGRRPVARRAQNPAGAGGFQGLLQHVVG